MNRRFTSRGPGPEPLFVTLMATRSKAEHVVSPLSRWLAEVSYAGIFVNTFAHFASGGSPLAHNVSVNLGGIKVPIRFSFPLALSDPADGRYVDRFPPADGFRPR